MEGGVLLLFFVVDLGAGGGVVVGGGQEAVGIAAGGENVGFPGGTIFVERLEIAENLGDFVLLARLAVRLPAAFDVGTGGAWEDHAIDEVSYALAVCVVEDLADHAFQEGLVLKLHLLFSWASGPLLGFEGGGVGIVVGAFGRSVGVDEAADVGGGGIELEGRALLQQHFAHAIIQQ